MKKIIFKKQMVILIGNIGEGKTTYCNKLVDKGFIAVSKDSLRYMIGNGNYLFDRRVEPTVKASAQNILSNFVKLGVNIVVDDCNVYRALRRYPLILGKRAGYKVI